MYKLWLIDHISPWEIYRLIDAEKKPWCTVHVSTLVNVSTLTR